MIAQTNFKTVVTAGSTRSQASQEKPLFSKQPPAVTGASSQENYETFTLSQPPTQDLSAELRAASFQKSAPAATGFNALSAEDKSEARKIMKDLSKKARLFARNDEGSLVRISPGFAKERLDQGQPVEVVTQLGQERTDTSSSFRSNSTDMHFLSTDRWGESSRSQGVEVKANYSSSPLTSWSGLLWEDDADAKGIPGTDKLPASGSKVTVSKSWEKSWDSYSEMHSGFFGNDVDINESSNFKKVVQTAQ